ncbi:pseudouridine synthase, partial [Candidatus Chlorohelix sp.]|uniref:pseudouridine synthase n=1 Tax=Candidatus Chlorohelix sp. TaxID=3139201 RepID=UPI00305F8218
MVIISDDDGERLQKALARAGIASRRTCEEMILAGRVMVNGKIVKKLGIKIDPATDKVTVDGLAVSIKPDNAPQKIYIALNKPVGYLSTVTDPQGRPTIMDLVKSDQRLFPIGRLDADTEGLLLLTNDGTFANALMHPRHNVEKEYVALLEGFPRMTELAILRRGVEIPIEDHDTGEHIMYKTHPAQVDFIRREGSNTLVKFVLTEGKKRQIRLMSETIGHPVLQLTRVSFGSLKLGDLMLGKARRLTAGEVTGLIELAAGEKKPRVERIEEPKSGFGQTSRSSNRNSSQPISQVRFPTRMPEQRREQTPWRKPEGDSERRRDGAPERGAGRPFEQRREQTPWRKPEGDSERRRDG